MGDVNGRLKTLMTSARGLKWLPVLAASKGLGAFCCLGLLLCYCLGNKPRWGVLF